MLKFLVDESAGGKLFKFLLKEGLDAKFVTDIIPAASDERVLELAEREERILITNDKDFGELIFRLNRPSSGVIFLRLKVDSPENRQRYVLHLIENLPEKLRFNFVVVTESKIRIKRIKGQ